MGKGQWRWSRRHREHPSTLPEFSVCLACGWPYKTDSAVTDGDSPAPTKFCTDDCAADFAAGRPVAVRHRMTPRLAHSLGIKTFGTPAFTQRAR